MESLKESLSLSDEWFALGSQAVKFQHREFSPVDGRVGIVSEARGDLVDRLLAERKRHFHFHLGGGVQLPTAFHPQGIDTRFKCSGWDQARGGDFHKAMAIQEGAGAF